MVDIGNDCFPHRLIVLRLTTAILQIFHGKSYSCIKISCISRTIRQLIPHLFIIANMLTSKNNYNSVWSRMSSCSLRCKRGPIENYVSERYFVKRYSARKIIAIFVPLLETTPGISRELTAAPAFKPEKKAHGRFLMKGGSHALETIFHPGGIHRHRKSPGHDHTDPHRGHDHPGCKAAQ